MPFYRAWYTSRVDAESAATAALANIVAAYASASGLDPVIAAGDAAPLAAPTVRLEVLTVENIPAGAEPTPSNGQPTYRVGYEMTEVVSGEKGRIWNNVPATWAPAAIDRSLGPTTPGTPSSVAASMGAVSAYGSVPPAVTLSGAPAATVTALRIEITTGGARGAAQFRWSIDGGASWGGTGVATAASVALGSSGLTAAFSNASNYSTDNVYTASPIAGFTTPSVTLTGTPADVTVLGVAQSIPSVTLRIDATGALGVATFSYSIDGGSTWTTGLTTGASVALGTTGVTASFPAGTYGVGVTYTANVIASHWAAPNVGDVAYHTVGDEWVWKARVVPAADGRHAVDLYTAPEGS